MFFNGISTLNARFLQSVSRRRPFAAIAALSAISVLATLLIVSGRSSANRNQARPSTPTNAAATQRLYVRAGELWPQLRWNLRALGDRLERPGKEQIILTGTLTRAGATAPATVNIEAPNRLTLTMRSGLQAQVIQFDGSDSSWATLGSRDRDLVETLLFDSAESFFLGQVAGDITRYLGSRFQLNPQSNSGPFYDLYAVTPRRSLTSINAQQTKLFHFNSDTHLLELITYQRAARVEIRLNNWQEINGQKVARRIERFENGSSVMTLAIDNIVFAPATPTTTEAR